MSGRAFPFRGRSPAALVLALLLAACTSAREPAESPDPPSTPAAIDALLETAVAAGVAPAIVAMVADPDGVLYRSAVGMQDVGRGIPIAEDSIFRMMSMTKPIASVAAMMLYEDGVFELDDPITEYLPDEADRQVLIGLTVNRTGAVPALRPPSSPVTIRQIFTHTSGAGYDFSNPVLAELREATGEDPGGFPLLFDPGVRWNYSVSTDRLGELVEASAGIAFDEFLRTRVFDPLGMADTFYVVPADKVDRVATTHQREADGSLTETPNPAAIGGPPRGRTGLYSTAGDYIRFLQMLLNAGAGRAGRLLAPESVELMRENHIGDLTVVTQYGVDPTLSRPFPMNAGVDKFGLGFQIAVGNGGNADLRSPGSYSWSGLYNTHFWVDPQRRLAGVLLTQLLPFYDERVMALYRDFEELANRTFGN